MQRNEDAKIASFQEQMRIDPKTGIFPEGCARTFGAKGRAILMDYFCRPQTVIKTRGDAERHLGDNIEAALVTAYEAGYAAGKSVRRRA